MATGVTKARVIAQHRGEWVVDGEIGELRVHISGKLLVGAQQGELPVVGDWVIHRDGVIEAVLPRRSAISRKDPAPGAREQVLVANVDVALIACALEGDFNPRRIERYVTAVREGGAQPVILLTKADICPDVEVALRAAVEVAPGAAAHAVSALTGQGLDELEQYLEPDRTLVLLGSSGVGKTTLLNRLTGGKRATSGLRADGRGRHTTTHRELVPLPGGAFLIDTPGLRELALWSDGEGIEAAFPEIDELATSCRFTNCGHETEPGCAVKAAVASGSLPAERLAAYAKLQLELVELERRRGRR